MATLTPGTEDFILYHGRYEIFICTLHGFAITQVDRHLQQEHEKISLPQRRQIVQNHRHQKAVAWNGVRTPPSHSAPIPGLHAAVPAFRCQKHDADLPVRTPRALRDTPEISISGDRPSSRRSGPTSLRIHGSPPVVDAGLSRSGFRQILRPRHTASVLPASEPPESP
jgi:hypothetical protein